MKKTIFVQASCFVFVVQLVYTIIPHACVLKLDYIGRYRKANGVRTFWQQDLTIIVYRALANMTSSPCHWTRLVKYVELRRNNKMAVLKTDLST